MPVEPPRPATLGSVACAYDRSDGLGRNYSSYADLGRLLRQIGSRVGDEDRARLLAAAVVLESLGRPA